LLPVVVVVVVVAAAEGGESGGQAVVGDSTVRFCCPELTHEGLWHHLAAVIHKASIMKNSSVSLFIDGNYIATQKVSHSDILFPVIHENAYSRESSWNKFHFLVL